MCKEWEIFHFVINLCRFSFELYKHKICMGYSAINRALFHFVGMSIGEDLHRFRKIWNFVSASRIILFEYFLFKATFMD